MTNAEKTLLEIARLKREEQEAERRRREAKRPKAQGGRPFPEDYPYMDEFEYLNSQES